MKYISKYIALGLLVGSVASCADLDTEYLGGYVTDDQKESTLEKNPDLASAGVNAIFSSFSSYGSVSSNHYDFGYPAVMLGLDSQGLDVIGKYMGDNTYNWFAAWINLGNDTNSGTGTTMMWYHMYNQISTENAVAATISKDTDNETLKFYRAQAVGARAFNYWVLAQTYQFNYATHQNDKCVPIITDENLDDASANGAPRATVQEVYDQILSDINEAISLLSSTSVTADQVISDKPKRMISLATAYGLRARIYLTMHKYSEAVADAQNAIANFSGAPYSMSDVSKPSFAYLSDNSWMWGIAIAETDRVVTSGIVNFPSHMGSLCYGYCTVGAWRWCNKQLYDYIPSSDVRKGWFLDENYTSVNLTSAQQSYINDYISSNGTYTLATDGSIYIMPYTQVKFAPYNDVLGQSTSANDIPLMRVEEMYYIIAEGQAMSGNVTAGKQTLENFVKTYRNPKYTTDATTAEELQDEIWKQRRVEFWGEGLSYFDIMRLNKGIDRQGCFFPDAYTFNIQPEDPIMLYLVPLAEITSNKQISDDDNNPAGSRPSPIAGTNMY